VSSVLVPPSLGLTVQLDGAIVVLTQFDQNSEIATIELTRHECGVLYDFLHQLLAGDFDQEQGE
jgi:hypothetical protein